MKLKTRKNAAELRDGAERVEIEWADSTSDHGWDDEDAVLQSHERSDHMLCCSVGYVIKDADDHIIIAQSFSATGPRSRGVGNVLTIPKSQIRDIKTLRR